ncbi:MAG: thioredoxin [Patescibacteria group bacterium]
MADINFTDQDFSDQVLKSEMPVVVDFWAPWCAPCRIVTPIIDELAKEYEGKIKVGKMNVDDNPNFPSQYGVMSIPSVFIFKNGQPVKNIIGAQSKENYKKEFDQAL